MHVTGKRRLLSFINQLISWYTLTVQLSWSGCRIFPPAIYGARCRLHPYSWVLKKKQKKLQKSRLKQSILSSTIGRPAYSQLRSPLKAASIRSLPARKGMTDVLASTHYSNTCFKNYSDVHCQAWRKMIPGQFPNGIWRLHGNPFPHSCTDKKKSRNW